MGMGEGRGTACEGEGFRARGVGEGLGGRGSSVGSWSGMVAASTRGALGPRPHAVGLRVGGARATQ